MNDDPKLSVEEQRFIDTQEIYRDVPLPPVPASPASPGATGSNPTAKANKTIQSRKTRWGNKTVSPGAMTKLENRRKFSAKVPQ